jgi:hypothetical protein
MLCSGRILTYSYSPKTLYIPNPSSKRFITTRRSIRWRAISSSSADLPPPPSSSSSSSSGDNMTGGADLIDKNAAGYVVVS